MDWEARKRRPLCLIAIVPDKGELLGAVKGVGQGASRTKLPVVNAGGEVVVGDFAVFVEGVDMAARLALVELLASHMAIDGWAGVVKEPPATGERLEDGMDEGEEAFMLHRKPRQEPTPSC